MKVSSSLFYFLLGLILINSENRHLLILTARLEGHYEKLLTKTPEILTASKDSFYLDQGFARSNVYPEYHFSSSVLDHFATYRFSIDSGNPSIRNWGEKYWELKIDSLGSKLSYSEGSRGLENLELSVNIEAIDKKLEIQFDSLIYSGCIAPLQTWDLQKGELLLSLLKTESGLEISSDFKFARFSYLFHLRGKIMGKHPTFSKKN